MSSWKIERVPQVELYAALALLLPSTDISDARAPAQQALKRISTGIADAQALVWARLPEAERLIPAIGVCWIEGQAGNVGYAHLPQVHAGLPDRGQCERELYEAAESLARTAGINWLQTLLDPFHNFRPLLYRFGFTHVSTLVYQAALLPRKITGLPELRIKPRPYDASQRTLLEDVLAATYEESLDCPALNGTRTPSETLQSYENIGQSGTHHWQFIYCGETLIGCLLIGTHAPEPPTKRPLGELIYWGVIPSERGHGYGREILELALAQAEELNVDKLVLAVDQANEPALRQYAQSGFFEWLRREAWGKQLLR